MKNLDRRRVALGVIGGLTSALVASRAAPQTVVPDCVCPEPVSPLPTPGTTPMSPDTLERIRNLLLNQALNPFDVGADDGPNPDPKYSEFWAQARPRDADAWIASGASPALVAALTAAPDQSALAPSWSEESFHEIGTDFGQTCSPSGCSEAELRGRPLNTTITIRAVDGGIPVDSPTFYTDVLRAISERSNLVPSGN